MSNDAHEATALPDEPALTPEALEELDDLLDELRTRGEEIPQWEFCDGFLTALICTRREVPAAEWLPMLLGDGGTLEVAEGQPLPLMEVFRTRRSRRAFWSWWACAWTRSAPSWTPT